MKRTYVDIIGEYYDRDDEYLYESTHQYGVTETNLRRLLQKQTAKGKNKFRKE